MKLIKKTILRFLKKLGYELVPFGGSRLGLLGSLRLRDILESGPRSSDFLTGDLESICEASKSQLGQDLFVLGIFGPNHIGFFVEFGATNGVDLSNTWILEKKFGWTGILAEPGKKWHSDLRKNRNSFIDTRCVYTKSKDFVTFSEVEESRELSTISKYLEADGHALSRNLGSQSYKVETVTLLDLLAHYEAPKEIDFLSIDTEGSEFEILRSFDFAEYSIRVICVEHNFTANRPLIKDLLTANGYKHVETQYSEFDDWYVKS